MLVTSKLSPLFQAPVFSTRMFNRQMKCNMSDTELPVFPAKLGPSVVFPFSVDGNSIIPIAQPKNLSITHDSSLFSHPTSIFQLLVLPSKYIHKLNIPYHLRGCPSLYLLESWNTSLVFLLPIFASMLSVLNMAARLTMSHWLPTPGRILHNLSLVTLLTSSITLPLLSTSHSPFSLFIEHNGHCPASRPFCLGCFSSRCYPYPRSSVICPCPSSGGMPSSLRKSEIVDMVYLFFVLSPSPQPSRVYLEPTSVSSLIWTMDTDSYLSHACHISLSRFFYSV